MYALHVLGFLGQICVGVLSVCILSLKTCMRCMCLDFWDKYVLVCKCLYTNTLCVACAWIFGTNMCWCVSVCILILKHVFGFLGQKHVSKQALKSV